MTGIEGLTVLHNDIAPDVAHRLFTDLMVDVSRAVRGKMMRVDTPQYAVTNATFIANANRFMNLSMLGKGGDAAPQVIMPPSVALLSGAVWDQKGRPPDLAIVNIYTDGNDFLSPHVDTDEILDPERPLHIFSFGDDRTMAFYDLPRDIDNRDPSSTLTVRNGTRVIMEPHCLTGYAHAILPTGRGDQGRRVSVSVGWANKGPQRRARLVTYTDMTTFDQGAPFPLCAGTKDECIAHWEALCERHGWPKTEEEANKNAPKEEDYETFTEWRAAVVEYGNNRGAPEKHVIMLDPDGRTYTRWPDDARNGTHWHYGGRKQP